MRKLLLASPVLTLLLAARAGADPAAWRPAPAVIASTAASPTPAVTLDRPVAVAPRAVPTAAVALDRPVPLADSPRTAPAPLAINDPRVVPVTYQGPSNSPGILFRGQSPDAQPMPLGDPEGDAARRTIATSFAIDAEPEPASQPKVVAPPPKPMPAPPPATGQLLRPIPEGNPVPGGAALDDCSCCDCTGCPCPDNVSCPGCGPAGYRLYASADYLLWFLRGSKLPPLVTSGPVSSLGVVGMPGTAVVIGDRETVDNFRSGVRGTFGYWLDDPQTWAVEGGFLFLGRRSANYAANSSGVPILARPFFNVLANAQDSELVANPLVPGMPTLLPLAGAVTVGTSSRLWGAEANLVRNLYRGPIAQVDVFTGFRYLDLTEQLDIHEALVVQPSSPAFAGTDIGVSDAFHMRNQFYGGQLGARGEFRFGPWFVDLRGSVAFGSTHRTADINGNTIITTPGAGTAIFPGGLLAQPSNSGRFTDNTFSVVPEAGLNVGYQLTDWARIYVGYSFLYWSDVARPANQLDFGVNPSQFTPPRVLVGPARPAFFFKDSDFWAQGVNVGLELRY